MSEGDGRYSLLASDFDETLAERGRVTDDSLRAIERLKASGRRFVLVTGRQLDDLLVVFPELAICDHVVAENGPVVYCPASREQLLLAPPPPPTCTTAVAVTRIAFPATIWIAPPPAPENCPPPLDPP